MINYFIIKLRSDKNIILTYSKYFSDYLLLGLLGNKCVNAEIAYTRGIYSSNTYVSNTYIQYICVEDACIGGDCGLGVCIKSVFVSSVDVSLKYNFIDILFKLETGAETGW